MNPGTYQGITLTQVLDELKVKGYIEDFKVKNDELSCREEQMVFSPEDLQIDEIYRLDAFSDPSEQLIVFALSSPDRKIKGVLINGYGICGDPDTNRMEDQLLARSRAANRNHVQPIHPHSLDM